MRVLIITDPFIPVPPPAYGGTERIAFLIGDQLKTKGFTVDLLAGDGSKAFNGKLVTHRAPGASFVSRLFRKLFFQLLCLRFLGADVVINLGRIDYMWLFRLLKKPTICVFQNPVSEYEDAWLAATPHVVPVGISQNQVRSLNTRERFRVIYNAIATKNFTFRPDEGRYLVFLGRLTYNKGVDIAIRVAKATTLPLRIAGNISKEEGQEEYFKREVEPHLQGDIEYVGPVNDVQKDQLLSNGIAMLFPIRWEEPFGIVMIESMACGTPVVAFGNGSVNEVVKHEQTGFICSSEQEMIDAVKKIVNIDRAACRKAVEEKFSYEVMADKYSEIIAEIAAK